tara:strand:+ start:15001 stop:16587 length:1587 start_codon:yes stop_codon:yes gene_type:complete
MQVFKFNRNNLGQANEQHLNLVYNQDAYSKFINHTFSLTNVELQIQEKKQEFNKEKRTLLVNSLLKQYENVQESSLSINNIKLLKNENAFTVTTGHQLSFFSGPMYFVVKILHVIKLSEQLKKQYSDFQFVPVYWMATEDHDFEEVQSMRLFNKEFTWETDQEGPVGRFDLDGFEEVKKEIGEMFRDEGAEIHSLLKAYDGKNFTEATRNLVHFLFKSYGLVIIDGDDSALKIQFSTVVKKELLEGFSFSEIERTNKELVTEGAKIQVKAREINLFYLKKGLRSRIISENNQYNIQGEGAFTETEIMDELEKHPERFSPNVILRPLYQELTLPNLAYIGGTSEISYWLQLKGVFDAVNCVYPLIGVRNSIVWIESVTAKKKSKINLHLEDIFKTKDQLKKEYVEKNSGDTLDFSSLENALKTLQLEVKSTILANDPAMDAFSSAENARLAKQIDGLKAKMTKISKSKHQVAMNTIDQIKDKLFPDGKMQERVHNFFSFCPDGNYTSQIEMLYSQLDPEEKDLLVLRES